MSLMTEVVSELQSAGVLMRTDQFAPANFSWCLRSASCPGVSSTAYICTGNEKCMQSLVPQLFTDCPSFSTHVLVD